MNARRSRHSIWQHRLLQLQIKSDQFVICNNKARLSVGLAPLASVSGFLEKFGTTVDSTRGRLACFLRAEVKTMQMNCLAYSSFVLEFVYRLCKHISRR